MVNWIKNYIFRKGSIWMVKNNTQSGSWMWRKILKCRDRAKLFYSVDVRDGQKASFWHERWTSLGYIHGILRGRQYDLGIPEEANVAACWNHQKRHHRALILNKVEEKIERYKIKWSQEVDVSMWKNRRGKFKKSFSTKDTRYLIREEHPLCDWHPTVWFKHATPRYSFIPWTAIHGKLSTGERILNWNSGADVSCGFCQDPLETRNHLFFEYAYSRVIWEALAKGIMGDRFDTGWENILRLLSNASTWSKLDLFITRHVFESAVHAIWRERNRRKHGEDPVPSMLLIKRIDKEMRNRFTVIRQRGDKDYEGGMALWFSTR